MVPTGQGFQWDDGSKPRLIIEYQPPCQINGAMDPMGPSAIKSMRRWFQWDKKDKDKGDGDVHMRTLVCGDVLHKTILYYLNEMSPALPALLDN